uniref:histidine kinase n=1 Tax=Roseihalotalea indica TaxID=2867963 RepID=A0AA49GIY8_9BACT|nr:ATP-binding protein [Tunicatimonas sp. TK19036]
MAAFGYSSKSRRNQTAERLSFKAVIEEVKEDLRTAIKTAQTQIYEELQATDILFPKSNLRSILYNLLSNAIKYRDPNLPAEVTIPSYPETEMIILEVEDNGLGLNQEQQAQLFTMFKRLHTQGEGTGIGLYTIKRIIENRGGAG